MIDLKIFEKGRFGFRGTSLIGRPGVGKGKGQQIGGRGAILTYITESLSPLDGIEGR